MIGINMVETIGSGHMPRAATQAKLHLPENHRVTEQLQELANGIDNSERYVPDWFNLAQKRYKFQSYGAYKNTTHMWEEE